MTGFYPQDTPLDAQGYQDLPFERLVNALQGERSLSHSPLFQVMFNHQQSRPGALVGMLAGLQVERLEWQGRTAQFDLQLDTHEEGEHLLASLTYATDLFDAARIEGMAEHWRNVLAGIVANPEAAIGELPMLTPHQVEATLYGLNTTQQRYPSPECVHLHIEAQAAATPDACALVFGEHALSYRELNQRANRLAWQLRDLGVGPEVRVGVACERSLELVIGLLAILKAGGAYVPLDPEYPAERLAYMVEDSGISLLLIQAQVQARLPLPESLPVVCLEPITVGDSDCVENLPNLASAQNLAYVIYTSGSTGRPKGAGNSHGALYNRLAWMQDAYALNTADRVLQKTPFSFDVSVWELFWPLMHGATLVVAAPGAHRDPQQLAALIVKHAITTLHFVPSMLHAFISVDEAVQCRSLRRIVCSGEALPMALQRQTLRPPGTTRQSHRSATATVQG